MFSIKGEFRPFQVVVVAGVFPHAEAMIGMCRPKGCGFCAVLV